MSKMEVLGIMQGKLRVLSLFINNLEHALDRSSFNLVT